MDYDPTYADVPDPERTKPGKFRKPFKIYENFRNVYRGVRRNSRQSYAVEKEDDIYETVGANSSGEDSSDSGAGGSSGGIGTQNLSSLESSMTNESLIGGTV